MNTIFDSKLTFLRVMAMIGLFMVMTAISTAPSVAQGTDCAVSIGVVQNGDTITGTSADDTIDCTNATSGKTINGGGGNDTITGGLGNDFIDGGAGNDTITGGPANDCLWGQEGNDTLTGSAGSNTIYAGAGENTVSNNNDPEGAITGCNEDGSVGDPTPETPTPGTPTLIGVSTESPSVTGGDTTSGTVSLSAAAPAGGTTVTLESDNPSIVGVASSVFIPEGDTTAVFEIDTIEVTEPTSTTITAGLDSVEFAAVIEVLPASSEPAPSEPTPSEPVEGTTLTDVSTESPSITGGDTSSGTVSLSAPAPTGGATVTLVSDSPTVVGVAPSVLVLEGDSTAVFEIDTSAVTETTYVTISAGLNGVEVTTVLEVLPGTSDSDTDTAPVAPAPDATGSDTASGEGTESVGDSVVSQLPSTGSGNEASAISPILMLLIGAASISAFALVLNQRRFR